MNSDIDTIYTLLSDKGLGMRSDAPYNAGEIGRFYVKLLDVNLDQIMSVYEKFLTEKYPQIVPVS
jgi:hypothetical protein